MNTFNRIGAIAFLSAASLSISPAAWSLGLGEATVESFLNEPLVARIDLISQQSDDVASVTAKLASADDYEMIGASLASIPVPIQFTVEDTDGDAYLMATSDLPIGSPVVRLIVEVNWSSGRMLREYTLFLDPPVVPAPAPIPRIDKRKQASTAAPAPSPVEAAPTADAKSPTLPSQPRVQGAEPAARVPDANEYGPVQSGDTLWVIARDWSRDSGLNINKVMIAIQQENPEAFIDENINLLKRGAILRMPAIDSVNSISAATAYNEVLTQEEEFTSRKLGQEIASPSMPLLAEESAAVRPLDLAPAVPGADTADDSAGPGDVSEAARKADQQAQADAAATDEAEPIDQLELVPPSAESDLDSAYGFEESEETADATVGVQTLRGDLARTEEELFNQQERNAYLEERIKELESQLSDAEQDRVADADMANMEQRLREERLAEARETAESESTPWYRNLTVWLVGLLVLAVAAVGLWMSRRRASAAAAAESAAEEESIREIKDEAEEVLRVLEETPEPDLEDVPSDEEVTEEATEVKQFGASDDDAEILDEESSDPEIQLDLARAYISMGDKEAARVILQEVVSNGNDEQQADAQKMLDLLGT